MNILKGVGLAIAVPRLDLNIPFCLDIPFCDVAKFMGLAADMDMAQLPAPTLANTVNIVVQVLISYPVMKFWGMLMRASISFYQLNNQTGSTNYLVEPV